MGQASLTTSTGGGRRCERGPEERPMSRGYRQDRVESRCLAFAALLVATPAAIACGSPPSVVALHHSDHTHATPAMPGGRPFVAGGVRHAGLTLTPKQHRWCSPHSPTDSKRRPCPNSGLTRLVRPNTMARSVLADCCSLEHQKSPCAGLFDGRYWVRTSDPQLVEMGSRSRQFAHVPQAAC